MAIRRVQNPPRGPRRNRPVPASPHRPTPASSSSASPCHFRVSAFVRPVLTAKRRVDREPALFDSRVNENQSQYYVSLWRARSEIRRPRHLIEYDHANDCSKPTAPGHRPGCARPITGRAPALRLRRLPCRVDWRVRERKIAAVAAENQYANVLEQIGGKYVKVTAIESNRTRPAHLRGQPSTAQASQARTADRNGVGYDTFMEKIESASPDPARKVINVQKLLGLPESTPNPHLWYKPTTMPAVAKRSSAIWRLQPAHAAYFQANATTSKHLCSHGGPRWRSSHAATRTRRSRLPSRSLTTCSKQPESRT